MRFTTTFLLACALAPALQAQPAAPSQVLDDESLTNLIIAANEGLRAQGMDYLIEGVEFLDQDKGRTSLQVHRQDYGWVNGDPRRADANLQGLSWAMDRTWMTTSTHETSYVSLWKAFQRAAAGWNDTSCVGSRVLAQAAVAEPDLTVFDFLFGRGSLGSPLQADIVIGGFRSDLQPLFGANTLAFTVTFVFVDGHGEPTDIDHDGRMDSAAVEIYFNDASPWSFSTSTPPASFDVATVVLHELGHALGLPHFGAPPVAAMNGVYHGVYPRPSATDFAALCSLYAGDGIYTHGSPIPVPGMPVE